MTERLWQIWQVSLELFPEGGNRYGTTYIIRKVMPNLESIKSKTKANLFGRLVE